jgi:hypothetical protein
MHVDSWYIAKPPWSVLDEGYKPKKRVCYPDTIHGACPSECQFTSLECAGGCPTPDLLQGCPIGNNNGQWPSCTQANPWHNWADKKNSNFPSLCLWVVSWEIQAFCWQQLSFTHLTLALHPSKFQNSVVSFSQILTNFLGEVIKFENFVICTHTQIDLGTLHSTVQATRWS